MLLIYFVMVLLLAYIALVVTWIYRALAVVMNAINDILAKKARP